MKNTEGNHSVLIDTIRELESRLLEAIRTSDVSFINGILHDDLLFIAPGGQLITKEMDLAAHRSGQMIVDEIRAEPVHVQLFEDMAVSTVIYETKGSMMGTPVSGRFRYLRCWKRNASGFKIVGGACVLIV